MDDKKRIENLMKSYSEIKDLYSETKDLNIQYFGNILELKKDYGILEFACVLELIIIVVLLVVIVL